jgi:hypothetical protein
MIFILNNVLIFMCRNRSFQYPLIPPGEAVGVAGAKLAHFEHYLVGKVLVTGQAWQIR